MKQKKEHPEVVKVAARFAFEPIYLTKYVAYYIRKKVFFQHK